jgi:uncharacterized protein YndB with AHSA1/START domain
VPSGAARPSTHRSRRHEYLARSRALQEQRLDADIDDLWSALTDPGRVARWYGRVDGDLRPGGQFCLYVDDADSDHAGRVEECEPPRRLRVTTRETDESYQRGKGVPPYDEARWGELVPLYQDLAASIG